MTSIHYIFIFLALLNNVFAQKIEITWQNQLEVGIDHYDIDEFANALQYFQKADSLNPNNAKINYYIGECWIKTNHEAKALPFLKIAYEGKFPDPELDFALALSYKLNHQFADAIRHFELYLRNHAPDQKKKPIQSKFNVERHIQNCIVGQKMLQKPIEVKITNLGSKINSKYPDYVPTISADETELIFTSRRDNSTGGKLDPADDHYFEDIYISHRIDSSWISAEKLGFGINTNSHDACVGLSPD